MTTHELLVEARNLLERDGWYSLYESPTGERYSDGPQSNCAAGAIRAIDRDHWSEGCTALANALGLSAEGTPPARIWPWNDTPGRTKAEVLAAFDKAIAATAPKPDTSFLSEPTRDPVPA